MSETNNTQSEKFENRPAVKNLKEDLSSIFTQLKALGVESVVAEFSGSGDEGSVGYVEITPKDIIVPAQLVTEIEDITYAYAELEGTDWVNNDGGHGSLIFDVATRKATLDMNYYSTESTNTGNYEING